MIHVENVNSLRIFVNEVKHRVANFLRHEISRTFSIDFDGTVMTVPSSNRQIRYLIENFRSSDVVRRLWKFVDELLSHGYCSLFKDTVFKATYEKKCCHNRKCPARSVYRGACRVLLFTSPFPS